MNQSCRGNSVGIYLHVFLIIAIFVFAFAFVSYSEHDRWMKKQEIDSYYAGMETMHKTMSDGEDKLLGGFLRNNSEVLKTMGGYT